jgi:LysM repeat protein
MELKKVVLISFFALIALISNAQSVIINKSDVIEERNGRYYYIHTVQKGQTVYSISRAYNVTPDEVYFENPGAKDGIAVDQVVIIPTINKETELKTEVIATNFDFFYHVAANNETFDQISSIYLIPKKYIEKANPNLSSPLREGEYVKVPVEDAFAILDGRSTGTTNTASYTQDTYKPISKPVSKPASKSTTSRIKGNNSNNLAQSKRKVQSTPKATQRKPSKPASETVSFDPEIPVIQDYRHVVILGETTQSIAKKYDIPVNLLKAANPGLGNNVSKGDRLRVPDKTKIKETADLTSENKSKLVIPEIHSPVIKVDTSSTEVSDNKQTTTEHIVKKKETLYSIGREYGVTVDDLITANKGLTINIKPGQKIIVPKKKITNPYIIHKAANNTKTSKIAKLYRIPVYQIREFNPDLGNRIYRNQELKIPVGSSAIIVPFINTAQNPHEEESKFDELPDDITINNHYCDFTPDTEKIFKVALLIPLSLEDADSLNYEQFFMEPQPYFKPFRFIQFYEGALIAIDSLSKQGVNIKFYVYDVDKNITKTIKVLKQRELRTMDLIIGPFFNNSFNQVALFAGNFNIPIVNPLSYRDAVVNNYKTVIKVKPGVYSQKEMLQRFIETHSPNSKTFLISQTSYLNADIVTDINNNIMSVLDKQVKIGNNELLDLSYSVAKRDSLFEVTGIPPPYVFEGTEIYPNILESSFSDSTVINNFVTRINYSVDSLYPFLQYASPIRNNLVILYGSKKSFILDFLNRINETRDTFDISLVGMPTWERINNLNNDKMNSLNLTYFSSSYIDFELDKTQDFIQLFRTRYNTEPDVYAYSGFDITYYFINALFYLGDNFNRCLEHFPMELLQGQYQFNRVGNSNNFENNYWNMLQMSRMTKIKIPDYLLNESNLKNEEEYFD